MKPIATAYIKDRWKPVFGIEPVKRGKRKGWLKLKVRVMAGQKNDYAIQLKTKILHPDMVRMR